MVRALFVCLLCIASANTFALSKVTATVDKNPVLVGEYFSITVAADDIINDAQPDTKPLLSDFVVGPISRSNSTRVINGNVSRQTYWKIQVLARKPGTYTIAPFTINGVSSEPFELRVSQSKSSNENANDAYIEAELTPKSPYVQQAAILSVKLFVGVDLIDGSLSNPMMEDANISQIGQQQESREVINGRPYMVVHRNYLIQPQKSGTFELTVPSLTGKARKNYRMMSVSAFAPDLLVDVKPMPANSTSQWLPSELVDVNQQWQGVEGEIKVGEPITRTITLTALNTTKEQLPEITSGEVDKVRVYPDKSERNHVVRDGRIIAQSNTSIAYVPQHAGTYTLPEITVNWFNTVIGREEQAVIPAKTITVVGGASADNTPTTTPPAEQIDNQPSAPNPALAVEQSGYPLWLVLSGYTLWVLTLLLWRYLPSKKSNGSVSKKETHMDINKKMLLSFAKQQNYSLLYQAIADYAQTHYGSVQQWQKYWDSQTKSQYQALQAALYSDQESQLDAVALVENICATSTEQAGKTQSLPPLH